MIFHLETENERESRNDMIHSLGSVLFRTHKSHKKDDKIGAIIIFISVFLNYFMSDSAERVHCLSVKPFIISAISAYALWALMFKKILIK